VCQSLFFVASSSLLLRCATLPPAAALHAWPEAGRHWWSRSTACSRRFHRRPSCNRSGTIVVRCPTTPTNNTSLPTGVGGLNGTKGIRRRGRCDECIFTVRANHWRCRRGRFLIAGGSDGRLSRRSRLPRQHNRHRRRAGRTGHRFTSKRRGTAIRCRPCRVGCGCRGGSMMEASGSSGPS